MELDQLTDFVSLAVAVFSCIIPAVWHLGTRIQKIAGDTARINAEICANLKVIEVRMSAIHDELKAARKARAEMWQEINSMRERVAALEVKNG